MEFRDGLVVRDQGSEVGDFSGCVRCLSAQDQVQGDTQVVFVAGAHFIKCRRRINSLHGRQLSIQLSLRHPVGRVDFLHGFRQIVVDVLFLR